MIQCNGILRDKYKSLRERLVPTGPQPNKTINKRCISRENCIP